MIAVAETRLDSLERQVGLLTMSVARPLYWTSTQQPWPKALSGASCFVLRFASGLVGVTANHVVCAFERQKESATAMIGCAQLDLIGSMLDRNAELDIATFRVTEAQLAGSGGIAVDCRAEWPPRPPERGREISFAGYPEIFRIASGPEQILNRAATVLNHVADITARRLLVTVRRERDIRIIRAPEFPDAGANWSGCSGGPVLVHVLRQGVHHWYPIALVQVGPGARDYEDPDPIDLFFLGRIDGIRTDGSIAP